METLENEQIQNWLCECRTESTRRNYEMRIAKFLGWYKGSINDFLALPLAQKRNILLKFQNAHQGENHNTVNAYVAAVLSFLRAVDMPLSLRGKTLRPTMDLTSHSFTNGDLSRMFDVANLKEKALLSLATSLGWEVSAVLGLKWRFVESLIAKAKEDGQQFVYWLSQRGKTGAPRLGVLNPLALEWVGKWLVESKRRQKRKRLSAPKRDYGISDIFDINAAGASKMVRRLAIHAGIITTGRVHFHKIRAWTMSGLSRAGFNEFQIKFLIGKAIPLTDLTYLETLKQEIEERYPKAYEHYLTLKPTIPDKDLVEKSKRQEAQIEELRNRVEKLQEDVRMFVLTKSFSSIVRGIDTKPTELE